MERPHLKTDAILTATAALFGSLVGGVSTFVAHWLTQRVQLRAQSLMKRHAEREALYAEFIVEASKRFADAWSHHAESPEVVARNTRPESSVIRTIGE